MFVKVSDASLQTNFMRVSTKNRGKPWPFKSLSESGQKQPGILRKGYFTANFV
jgi:hypothetical protein